MIDIASVTKNYRGTRALAPVTFTAPDGALTYLLGNNGSGKSTLLRCVAGISTPTSGAVTVDGRALRSHSAPSEVLGVHLDPGAFAATHTSRRHLRWLATMSGVGRRRVGEVLAECGLDDVANTRIAGLSLGMRQRVGIASALLARPRNIILDEPLNGLDVQGIRWLRALLRRLADDGHSVLIASHLLTEVERTADRVVVLGPSGVLADGTAAEVRGGRHRSLEDAFVDLSDGDLSNDEKASGERMPACTQ